MNGEDSIKAIHDGAVELYYDNVKQVQTTADGFGFVNNCTFSDSKKIKMGDSNDLEIYHNGTSYIDNSNSHFYIRNNVASDAGGDIFIEAKSGETSIKCQHDGAVELYYDNSKKFETKSSGAKLYGTLLVDGIIKVDDNDTINIGTSSDLMLFHDGTHSRIHNSTGNLNCKSAGYYFNNAAGTENMLDIVQNGSVSLYYDNSKKLETTALGVKADYYTGEDNAQLRLGDSGDLEIYHDGSNSRIHNTTGALIHRTASYYHWYNSDASETLAQFNVNGACELYYNNSKKFETKNGGVYITGDIETSGDLYMLDNEKIRIGNAQDLELYHNGSHSYIKNKTGNLYLMANDSEVGIQINPNGEVKLRYDDSNKIETTSYGIQVGSGGGSVFSGLSNYQAYVGFDADSSSTFGGIVMGAGPTGNSPYIAASKAGNGSALNLGLHTNGTKRMTIDTSGSIGAPSGTNIYNASDSRLKKNVTTLDKGLETIKSLRPVSFNWIDGFCDEEKDPLYGFIAQEVETVDPNLIEEFGDGTVTVGDQTIENSLRVNEKFIIPMLVKAVQELSAKVAALEAK
jgi:hypothetical protein